MRPVVLTVLDGKNFILGTFDTTGFQDWWKSEPFPGAIDTIGKPTHVYGQYHVCICKMLDGTYSIYRTSNMGKSWESVYNTVDVIYSINVIDYGWVIASTSSGWIESTLDSGKTWSVLSSFAPGCKTVINLGDDILFAADGNYIWRSYDYGETWSSILDCHNIRWLHYSGSWKNTIWTGVVYPTLTGYQSRIVSACGPYLVASDDFGDTWTIPYAWSSNTSKSILQTIVIDITGSLPTNAILMICRKNSSNNTIDYIRSTDNGVASFPILFTYPFKGNENGLLTSYDVLRPGSPERDILATFTTYDSENNPIVKYSIDGFATSYSPDISSVIVYEGDPTQEIISDIGQSTFNEEFFTSYTWTGPTCHNSGKYIADYNKTVRGISWDQDILMSFRKTKSVPVTYSTLVSKILSKNFDVLNKKTTVKSYSIDSLIKTTTTKPYLHGMLIQDAFELTYEMYLDIASRTLISTEQDILLKTVMLSYIYCDALLFDSPDKTYAMGISLIDDHVEQIMNSIERYSPQSPDIRYPDIPYVPYDSRTQNVTL